jgi:predicted MFS family arabinose efflux permease
VLGIVIGALFVQFVTWRWIFWFNACVSIPISLASILLIPNSAAVKDGEKSKYSKLQRLDIIGVTDLTIAFILFIFAITSASTDGWDSAKVLAPLIISIFMVIAFFIYEARIPEERASL